jgi:hypothetical protein
MYSSYLLEIGSNMSNVNLNSCNKPLIAFNDNKFQVTCSYIAQIIAGLALVIFGSLYWAGYIPLPRGFIFPFINFGPTIEGAFVLGLGAIITSTSLAKIFSPTFRNCFARLG